MKILDHTCELNLLMTAVYSTFILSKTFLASDQCELSWLVSLK